MLDVVAYHYVREPALTAYPRIHGMVPDVFVQQLDNLSESHDWATLESALAFLEGAYTPPHRLCLLTFDDGLSDHYKTVTPILAERGIQGLFFPVTECLENQWVASVHMNQFLLAKLGLEEYRRAFLREMEARDPRAQMEVDLAAAVENYRWDKPDVAAFKFLVNHTLGEADRRPILDSLFERFIGPESEFARELYFDWEEAREMQAARMILGGHSHRHVPLSSLDEEGVAKDISASTQLLRARLSEQPVWPFAYPYGTKYALDRTCIGIVRSAGYSCAFVADKGSNPVGSDPWVIRRHDANDIGL